VETASLTGSDVFGVALFVPLLHPANVPPISRITKNFFIRSVLVWKKFVVT
jgi:hypothetical protein